LEIEFFLRIQIFNREMQKSLDFGPESAAALPDFDTKKKAIEAPGSKKKWKKFWSKHISVI
jgi:hypothetical protein